MKKAKVGIVGAAGYTGGELIRLLLWHPYVEIAFAHSRSRPGKPVSSVHTDLLGDTDLLFTDTIESDINILFLCLPHGETKAFLESSSLPDTVKIIDLSNDFRLGTDHGFIYGLPELQHENIRRAVKVANPGCFATAIQLALLPLAHAGLMQEDVHVSATTGSTGAGVKLADTLHFTWRDSNLSTYKTFTHQHLAEIRQSLHGLQPDFGKDILLIPYRGDFTRGIIASVYTHFKGTLEDARARYEAYYSNHPFTHISHNNIDLKQVVNTNKCLLYLEKHGDKLLIVSVIDNLLKGASGQAVQNMNLMMGWEESSGLRLKPSAY
jgi:N-acetyl-gamma-glutamyl-phosphate reductase